MDCDIQGVKLKLEEDSWSTPAMIDLASVVGNTVLVCAQWLTPGRDVCSRNDMEEILVGDEIWIRISIASDNAYGELTFMSELKGTV